MNEKDRPTTEGTRNSEDEQNVVRLPRDWLGPREELIPFGPRADEAEGTSVENTSSEAPTAADFWSGEAPLAVRAAVHSEDAAGGAGRQPSRQSRRALWSRRRELAMGGSGSAPRGRTLPARGVERWVLVGGTAAAALILAVMVSVIGGGSSTRQLQAARSDAARRSPASGQFLPGSLNRLGGRVSRAISARADRGGGRPHHPRTSRGSSRRSAGAPHPAVAQPVTYRTPSSDAGGGEGSAADNASAGSSAGGYEPSSSSSSSTPAATSTGGHSSGSQPALGAGGALAPGSSPDG
jgi:hypothetical protein